MRQVTDPAELVELFGRHAEVHPYGLADVDEPYWSRSTWWRRGDVAVGLLDLPAADTPVVYAVAPGDLEGDARELLADLALGGDLPGHFVINGPRGLGERLAAGYRAEWTSTNTKLWLAQPQRLGPPHPGVEPLGPGHFAELVALYDTDPDAGDFFNPPLLESGHYVGRWVDGRLVAAAGVHVVSPRHGVAAIGNVATDPEHRRRGHARALVATLAGRLRREVPVVGLNVAVRNVGARRLYEDLGFAAVVDYDEAELVAGLTGNRDGRRRGW